MPKRSRTIWFVTGKLTFLFLLLHQLGVAQVSLDQKVSYQGNRQDLSSHLKQLENLTGCSFSYSTDLPKIKKRIKISFRNRPFKQLLDYLGQKYQFSYRQIGPQIVLKRRRRIKTAPTISQVTPPQPASSPPSVLTQTIRGKIIDAQSKTPLIGANILLLNTGDFIGTSTDVDGSFVLPGVPVGRQRLEASYIGYEPYQVTALQVISGKETEILIELTESTNVLSEIVVRAKIDKMSPLNEMATISARAFTVEETSRYAASFLDPARMVKSFPGVSFINDLENEIIIRGNPPVSLLWRLEGVPIPNPNHFGTVGSSSGAISMLSSNTMANSDFFTGAFPSEYGNSLSGVFDLKMRKGNANKPESTLLIGSLGIDFATEGPLNKSKGSSYLVNYRYSSLALLDAIGLNPTQLQSVPNYQDLSFKLHLPTEKAGIFDVFGLGGFNFDGLEVDLREQNDPDDFFEEFDKNTLAIAGVSHLYTFSSKDYLKTTAAFSFHRLYYEFNRLEQAPIFPEVNLERESYRYLQGTLNLNYTRKFNVHHHLRMGFTENVTQHNLIFSQLNLNSQDSVYYLLKDRGAEHLLQSFVQWQVRPNPSWTINLGFHQLYHSLNGASSTEPRIALKWQFTPQQNLSLGIGKHSHVGDITTYLARRFDPQNQGVQPFRNLGIPKAWHYILGYQWQFAKDWHFKAEAYYQYLYDVPVSTSSEFPLNTTFNIANNYDVLNAVELDFSNAGTGRNIGLEVTLEKFFSKQYYLLFTGSVYDAKFRTFDNQRFSTRFNGNYIFNLTTGREWLIRKKDIFSLNTRIVLSDGNRYTPIDLETSQERGRTILRNDLLFSEKAPLYFRPDLSLTYTINEKKASHAFQIDIQNILHHRNTSGFYYDRAFEQVFPILHTGIIPVVYYRLSF